MESKFKFKFRIDKRYKLDDNTYPIYVNVHIIETNTNRGFSLNTATENMGCSEKDFDSIWTNRFKYDNFGDVSGETLVYGTKLEIRTKLKIAEDRLNDICQRQDVFTYQDVKKEFFKYVKPKDNSKNIYVAFDSYIDDLKKQDRYKTAKSYRTSRNNIFRYANPNIDLPSYKDKDKQEAERSKIFNKHPLSFREITVDWLKRYDRKRRRKVALDTVRIDTSNLRAIWNLYATDENYPYAKGNYTPPTGESKNESLDKDDLKKILNFNTDNVYLQEARDYFLFSYFNGGMNFKDIVLLKKNQVVFVRSKTKFTAKKQVKIEININDHLKEIIKRNKGRQYLFKILDGITGEDLIQEAIDKKMSSLDKQIKKLAKKLDINSGLSWNWARHSYATNVFTGEVNLKAISESMGHTNLKTTEGYIDSLIDKEKNKIKDVLDLD